MCKKMLLMALVSFNVNATEANFLQVDLSGSGTKFNSCVLEQLKKQMPPIESEKVVERGFAFSGSFSTHPLFSSLPVMFVSYQEDVAGLANEVKIVRDVHVAIPSFQRNGWQPNFQEQTVSAVVTGDAYIAVFENNADPNQSPLKINISACIPR